MFFSCLSHSSYRYKDIDDSVSFIKKTDASKLIKSRYQSSFLHPAPGVMAAQKEDCQFLAF